MAIAAGNRQVRRNVTPPDRERDDQQHERNGDRVLGFKPYPGCNAEKEPGAAAEREPDREPEDDQPGQLIERDRLEQSAGSEHQRRERDQHGGDRLRSPTAAELGRDPRSDNDGAGAGENREQPETHQRPAEQRSGQRRDQKPDRRELDVSALEVQTRHGVVERVSMPAVASRERQLQARLDGSDRKHRGHRKPVAANARLLARPNTGWHALEPKPTQESFPNTGPAQLTRPTHPVRDGVVSGRPLLSSL